MTVYIIQSVSSTYTYTCLDTLWIIYTVTNLAIFVFVSDSS